MRVISSIFDLRRREADSVERHPPPHLEGQRPRREDRGREGSGRPPRKRGHGLQERLRRALLQPGLCELNRKLHRRVCS